MKSVTFLALSLSTPIVLASSPDPLAPRPNGMQSAIPTKHAIMGGTVHISPSIIYPSDKSPIILIENGRITEVFEDSTLIDLDLQGYQIHELDPNSHVYPGFIDPYIEVDAPNPPSNAIGTHWSDKVTPQRDALDIGLPQSAAKNLRELGFTSAMIAPDDGIFRGWSSVVSTAQDFKDDSLGDPPTYLAHAGMMMGFDRGGWGDPGYPTSHMGVMALMRQTFSDAQFRSNSTHTDSSCLDEITPSSTTYFYETNQELEALLADNVAQEFDHPSIVIIDNGTAHRRLEAFKEMAHPIITPLRYPRTPDVFNVGGADSIDLPTLQHHERAPANARWLLNSGLQVALTTSKMDQGDFWSNLHIAIEKGLPQSDALAMITTNPASILNLKDQGALNDGFVANFVVANGNLFDPSEDAKIIDTWIDGRRHHINDRKNTRFDGSWTAIMVGTEFSVELTIDGQSLSITHDTDDEPVITKGTKVNIDGNSISWLTDYEDDNAGAYINSATLAADGTIRGTTLNPKPMSYTPEPTIFQWVATRNDPKLTTKDFKGTWNAIFNNKHELTIKVQGDKVTIIEHVDAPDSDDKDISQEAINIRVEDDILKFDFEHEPFGFDALFSIALNQPTDNQILGAGLIKQENAFPIIATLKEDDSIDTILLPDLPATPFGPYAYDSIPNQGTYMLHGATIWTQSDEGVLEDAWVLVQNGKITQVGTGGFPEIGTDQTIDATGMHITPGLIDAHSHTGLFRFGVNESGQAVTAECRIADSLDPGHPGFYRQLAGGLTTANLLHGSANPIGGQSQTIKLRWNSSNPTDMHFEGSKPGIKFALGENVKQSNWGDRNTTRYPQTRMGVETLFRDRFTKAQEYTNNPNKSRDLELETLAQILEGDRLIHCHSYRQDEILMLCRIAEEFGFKIGTFQHGLETYKVAEIVKKHAIGTSIFSDWWAYKVEVTDAIPFAGSINHEVGLLTSFNSDSDDLARRMHVEAGKALKYSKLSGIEMSEQDALNFVTLNPAIQLGIDDRVGSLESGKDADLVLWTGHPLSSLSRPEITFVDGRIMFSRELDQMLREQNDKDRQRLIQNILRDGKPIDESEHDEPHDHDHAQSHYFNINQGDCGCNQSLPAYHTNY